MDIKSSMEISIKLEKRDFLKSKIRCSADAAAYARNFYKDDIDLYESVFVIFMNTANDTIAFYKISQGGINASIIDIRLISKCALDCLCVSVILIHNHPSGNLNFSNDDINSAIKLRNALGLFDIKLLDSIVLTSEGCSSMENLGIIQL
jgi:DNA repair protein RadC